MTSAFQPFQTILVPVTGASHSLDTIPIACALARSKKATVIAVHVIEVGRGIPLDANLAGEARRGEQVLRKAEEIAKGLDYHISGELLQAREAGTAIVDEATDRGADLIILGVHYSETTPISTVGKTGEYVLKHATCPVLLFRQTDARADGQLHHGHHGG